MHFISMITVDSWRIDTRIINVKDSHNPIVFLDIQ